MNSEQDVSEGAGSPVVEPDSGSLGPPQLTVERSGHLHLGQVNLVAAEENIC